MHAVSLDLDDEDEPENPAEDEEGEESSDRERSVELARQAKKHDAGGGAEDGEGDAHGALLAPRPPLLDLAFVNAAKAKDEASAPGLRLFLRILSSPRMLHVA